MELNGHPQVIKDLRKFINPNVIQNKKFLDHRISLFNKSLELKLNIFNDPSLKHSPKF